MSGTIFTVQGLAAGYDSIQILWDVDIEVMAGEIVALVGPNGAGKTTVMKTIAGLVPAQQGSMIFEGRDITVLPVAERVRLGLSLVPEGRQLFAGMSVTENLLTGAYLRLNRQEVQTDLEAIFALFPSLYERRRHLGGLLSGGEQQMCSIGRALMARPKFLLIDELSLGLAPLMVERIAAVLEKLNREGGLSILLVEQDVPVAFGLASRAYVLESGSVRKTGATAGLKNDPEIKVAYLGI
ncbi:MAG TPA: ABC transporter ATP-binding protein [Thermodesulfobacteriota bacterium]|nr:ABC transporter ATP-binding protein [Thermodesulfobacteriota bacterium]